ncbi:MAG TPA: DedA family protein [Syntrophales bacterium]|nr:DedA family protein [Syntrophales bacterium]
MSTSTLEYIISTYGYWAILIGTFLEGETILIIGGLSAHLGLLELPYVVVVAFIGSLSGDQSYYLVGYFKGRELLSKHHKWAKRLNRIYKLLERYRDFIMLGFRFVYGTRIMIPFVIGMRKEVSMSRFLLFDAAGAALWSVSVAAGGYFFGYALEAFIKDVKRYEAHTVAAIAAIGIIVWVIHKYRDRKRAG